MTSGHQGSTTTPQLTRAGLAAVVLLTALLALAAAPVATAHVYWTNNVSDVIGRSNLDASGIDAPFVSLPAGSASYGMTVGASRIYWTDLGTHAIGRANLDGSGVDQRFITGINPAAVAVDAAHIYWADPFADKIGRANIDGTMVDPSFISTGVDTSPEGVAVDGAHVYWTNTATGTIGRANLDGTSPNSSFITGAKSPWGIAVNATHIFWANDGSNTIGRAAISGSPYDVDFITGASGPIGVALNATHVYWATVTGGKIYRAKLDGSGSQSFLDAGHPAGVAVTPLDTTITAGPSGTVGSSEATFSFVAGEPAGFQCRLDAGSFAPCTSPAKYAGLADGQHTFSVRAAGSAGDLDPTPAQRIWDVTTPAAESEPQPGAAPACSPADANCSGTDAPPSRVRATVSAYYDVYRSYTRLRRLKVIEFEPGIAVQLRCRGRGCPFRRKNADVDGASVNLLRFIKLARLRPDSTLEVRVTKPGTIGTLVQLRFRKAKRPIRVNLCLAPGATKPVRC